MASTPEDICNLGMILLGAEQIGSLSAPSTSRARTLALVYPQARDSELRKRRWKFARQYDSLPKDPSWAGSYPRKYRYQLHGSVLRVLKPKGVDWAIQRGYVYTDCDEASLVVEVIRNDVHTGLYDPCFVDALVARIAYDTCEIFTQSNSKKAEARTKYKDAIAEAGRLNAFEIEKATSTPGSWTYDLGG